MTDDEYIDDLRAQLAAARKSEKDALDVLSDLLAERGQSWVMEVVKGREDLEAALSDAMPSRCGWCGGERHRGGSYTGPIPHLSDCKVAHWLRVLGGPEETQRQVEAAWEEAMASRRESNPLALATTSDRLGWYGNMLAINPESRAEVGWTIAQREADDDE